MPECDENLKENVRRTGRVGREQAERQELKRREREESDRLFLLAPPGLSAAEKEVWDELAHLIVASTRYNKTAADKELLRQYCQTRILRDRAWTEYNRNPERYTRIVTGLCADGKTPKVTIKENEHYKTLVDCNRQLEKLLKDFGLTPDMRTR